MQSNSTNVASWILQVPMHPVDVQSRRLLRQWYKLDSHPFLTINDSRLAMLACVLTKQLALFRNFLTPLLRDLPGQQASRHGRDPFVGQCDV